MGSGDTAVLTAGRELTRDEKKIVKLCADAFVHDLSEAIAELIAGVRASGKQASASITVVLKKAKGRNLHVRVEPRVRAAREATEFTAHVDDGGQLSLGWIDVEDDGDDADGDAKPRRAGLVSDGDDRYADA